MSTETQKQERKMEDFAKRKGDRREKTSATIKKAFVPRPFGDRIVVVKDRRGGVRRVGHSVVDNDGTKIHFE